MANKTFKRTITAFLLLAVLATMHVFPAALSAKANGNGEEAISRTSAGLGDVNGDGDINAIDYLLVKRAVLGTYTLTDAARIAADIQQDGTIDAVDYMLLKRYILGTYQLPTAKYPTRPTGYPTVCGSFMQPGSFANYDLARMKKHLGYLREVGIDTLILQWSFVTAGDKVSNVYYEDSFNASEKGAAYNAKGSSLVETILQAAEALDMKVFIGLNNNDEWWGKFVNDKDWLTDQFTLGVKGAQQIYDAYKEKYPGALYGWYFVFEFYNHRTTDTQIDNAAYLLNGYLDRLTEIDPSMPMMLSPFLSSSYTTDVQAGEMWEKIFAKTNFRAGDIFCCQDSVGSGYITLDQLDGYYRALKKAVDQENGLRFWANNEDFTQSDWTSATLKRFVRQMEIASKYVEEHVTFAYSHYQNPDVGKTGNHLAYKAYFETGKIPACTLPAPELVCTAESDGRAVTVNGSFANDDQTAWRVHVKKNGKPLKTIDLSAKYGAKTMTFAFSDTNSEDGGSAEYEVFIEDYCGNFSPSAVVSVTFKGKYGTNVAQNKTYEYLKAPEAAYPDEDGKALTDGKKGEATYSDQAWVGFLGKPEIVIDLGERTEGIHLFKVNTLGGGFAGVFTPTSIEISVSDDGVHYTKAAAQTFAADANTGSGVIVERSVFPESGSVSARYVKFSISTNQSWIFLDELSIFAE